MHITLTGNLGSGKSTICKILENKYGFEIYSTGKAQRTIAEEMGISVLEMNQLMCRDHSYDKRIDDTTARVSKENQERDIVFDSRLAWSFVEKSFKVFLSVSLLEAAKRVYHDNRGTVETYQSEQEAMDKLRLRAQTEDNRYRELYNLEYFDFSNYNLVLDSTHASPELLAKVLLLEAEQCDLSTHTTKILMSPKRLGITGDSKDNKGNVYYPQEIIKIKKTEEDFMIYEGEEIAEYAVKEGYPFVKVQIAAV